MWNDRVPVVCPDCLQPRTVFKFEPNRKRFTGRCAHCNAVHNLSKIIGLQREQHPRWAGGLQKRRPDGYLVVNLPSDSPFISMATSGNRVFQHRLIVAQSLGRSLGRHEIVHHLNGIRDDNRLENLALVDVYAHEKKTLVKLQQLRILELEEQLRETTNHSLNLRDAQEWQDFFVLDIS